MAINSKFIEFATKAKFDEQLKAGNIPINSIVTIIDTKQLWIRGLFISDNNHTHDYLPITGGTLTGNLYVKKGNTGTYGPALFVSTVEDEGVFGVHKNGVLGAYLRVCNGATKKARFNNGTTEYDLYHAGNSNSSSFDWSANNFNAITAKVSGANSQLLTLNRTDGDASNTIKFQGKTITKHLGFYNGILKVGDISDISQANEIWHDGNKANQIPNNATNLTTSDLNSIITPGFYYQDYTANATSARNYPVNLAGSLEIIKAAGLIQRYISYGSYNITYIRGYYNGSWTAWRTIYSSTNANLSTIDWSARSLNLYGNINHYIDSSKFLFRVTKETNGGAIQLYDINGARKSLFRGYAVDGVQLLLEAGGIQSAGEIFANNDKKVYHAGNSNLSSINWVANGLYATKLQLVNNGKTTSLESQNSSYFHFITDAELGFYFDKNLYVKGELYAGTSYNQKVWHAGNLTGIQTAHGHNRLFIDNTSTTGASGSVRETKLQFLQKSGDTTINPDTGWWSVLRTQHGGYDNGYWQEMAYSFSGDVIKFRRNVNGTKSAWVSMWHSGNANLATIDWNAKKFIVYGAAGISSVVDFYGDSASKGYVGWNRGDNSVNLGNLITGKKLQLTNDSKLLYDGKELGFSSHNHTTLTGVTSIGFATQSSDSSSISTTISGTATYFDFNLADDINNDKWRWRFTPSGVSTYSAMELVPVSNTQANLNLSGNLNANAVITTANITVNKSTGSILTTNNSEFNDFLGINDTANNGGAYIGKRNYWIRTGNATEQAKIVRNGTGYTIWHAGNDGSGSGLDADLLDGLHAHSGRNNEANKIVRTDASGHLQIGYLNSSSGNENNNSNPDRVWGSNSTDGYLRTYRTSALSVASAVEATKSYALGTKVDIKVDGSSNTYYPVVINSIGTQTVANHFIVYRDYAEQAPPDWYSSTHKGSLLLDFEANYGGWGGASYGIKVNHHRWSYVSESLCAGLRRGASEQKFVIWLRGGGAVYHIASPTQRLTNASINIYYATTNIHTTSGYTDNVGPITTHLTLSQAVDYFKYYDNGALYDRNSRVYSANNTNIGTGATQYAAGNHSHSSYASTITTTGTGNAITALSISGNTITATKGSSFLSLAGGTLTGKVTAPSSGAGVYGGAIELRERGNVGATQSSWDYSPALTFHWANRYAKRLGLRSDGLFSIDNIAISLEGHTHNYLPTTGGTVSGTLTALTLGVNNSDPSTGRGVSLYGGAQTGAPTYGIMFAGTATFGKHGHISSDWSTYLTMSDTTSRGWIFRRGSTNVASINGAGQMVLNGSATATGFVKSGTTDSAVLLGAGGHISYSTGGTASTIAARDSAGDLNCRLVRTTYGDQSTIGGGIVFRMNNSNDNYLRVCNSQSAIRTWLGVPDTNHTHQYVNTSGRLTQESNSSRAVGMRYYEIYGNGYPITYGNLLQLNAINGISQLAMQWHGNELYYRSAPDTSAAFNSWARLWTSTNFNPDDKISKVSANRPGVTRLYRNDDDSGYNVRVNWENTFDGYRWVWKGYQVDAYHAGCYVTTAEKANSANSAGYAGKLSTATITDLNSPNWGENQVTFQTYNGTAANKPYAGNNANGVMNFSFSKHATANHYGFQLANGNPSDRLYFRQWTSGPGSWRTIAYLDDVMGKSQVSEQLEAFTAGNFTGGSYYVKAIRYDGWHTRLYMGYHRDDTRQNTVHVGYADNATNATNASTASNVMKSSWTDACIKVREHSNYTWLRNSAGGWVFQTGTTGDDWTQSFSIFSGSVASASDNSAWMEIGQRQSNATNGKYRGIRIRKYSGSSCVDGDLQVANVYAYTGAQFSKLNVDSEGKCYVNNTANRRAGMYGVYDSYKTGHIWSMGTAYMIPNDGSNFGNLYGLAYKHTNNTTGGNMASGHQMVWCVSGSPKCAMGDNLWTSGVVIGSRITAGYDSGVANSVNCSDWFRSSGNTGWYNATHGGGIYMTDGTWVRVSHSKKFHVGSTANDALYSSGGVHAVSGFWKTNSSTRYLLNGGGGHEDINKIPQLLFGGRIRYNAGISNYDCGRLTDPRGVSIGYSTSRLGMGSFKITHNLGHTNYITLANPYWDAGWQGAHMNCFIRIEEQTSTYVRLRVVNADNGNLVESNVMFGIFGTL